MPLLVSIHDVTPAWAEPVRALWALCRSHGVTPALLVVPDWHGGWPLESHPEYVAWLQARARDGAEVLLHGERHDEVGLPRSVRDSVRAFGRTAREGEFLTLRRAAADKRIADGLRRLRALELHPIGFVPPAWLAREDTFDAVAAAGLAVSEDAAAVRVHGRNARLRAPALRWSGRTTTRAYMSAVVAAWRWRTERRRPLVRLALHPQDLGHPVTARSVYREVARWLALRDTVRYADV